MDKLSPEVKANVLEAAEQFSRGQKNEAQDVQRQGGNRGYQIIFAGYNGCGRSHDFNRLQQAGVPVSYINVNHDHSPVNPRPPFREIPTRNSNEAFALADRYNLGPVGSDVSLVGPRGFVAHISTRDRNFAQAVEMAIAVDQGRGQQGARGRGR